MIDIQETIKKIDKLQSLSDEGENKKNRLEGEALANEKRLIELEARCVEEIGVSSLELDKLLEDYEQKILKYTAEVESILTGVK